MPAPTIHHGDCLEVLRSLPDASIDAVVTDPPYALSFMGKAWDSHDTPIGFQAWCQLWAAECLRVLKPGGHLLAFGGTRTWHRLACAVEDAGFEVRDSIAWMYGSGFPKSLDVSKAIDKDNGRRFGDRFALGRHIRERREVLGLTRAEVNGWLGAATKCEHYESVSPGFARVPTLADFTILRARLGLSDEHLPLVERIEAEREVVGRAVGAANGSMVGLGSARSMASEYDATAPATDDARTWQGWGTALKPAFEPIVVARKPLVGTVAGNVLAHGTGALNIDGCRVEADWETDPTRRGWQGRKAPDNGMFGRGESRADFSQPNPAGRWPANVILDEDQADALDQQSGVLKSGSRKAGTYAGLGYMGSESANFPSVDASTGGASRFFFVAEGEECDEDSCPDCEWETHHEPSRPFVPFDQMGERFRYAAKAPKRERPVVDGVAHPTVKPIALMRWLVRLVTPPGGTVLEPFAGSGTTVEACILEGFNVIAIEREADYLPLIQSRIFRAQAAVAVEPEPDLFSELDGEAS